MMDHQLAQAREVGRDAANQIVQAAMLHGFDVHDLRAEMELARAEFRRTFERSGFDNIGEMVCAAVIALGDEGARICRLATFESGNA